MEWTKESVIKRLKEIEAKGYLPIPEDMYRNDDGIVGQVLEREFDVDENNLHIADLGTYELKGMRITKRKSNKLTLFHKTSTSGLTPIQIFDRFSYVGRSKRGDTQKRKLFTTINGKKENRLGFVLRSSGSCDVKLYYKNEYLATWDLTSGIDKIQKVLLAFAETMGSRNTKEERFHYVSAYILSNPRNIYEAIRDGAVVMELCIDQPADGSKPAHDRGPHIRISVKKLDQLFENVEQIL